MDIYNYNKMYGAEIKRVNKSNTSEKNKELILEYRAFQLREGLSKPRIIKCMYTLRLIAEMLEKDFDKANKKDIEQLVTKISEMKKKNGTEITETTKGDFKKILKKFAKWLVNDDVKFAELYGWIKHKNGNGKIPVYITEEELKKMIETTSSVRDKALISVLWDSGMRIGELTACKLKHVKIKGREAEIICPTGKTGARRVLLIPSVPYLANWIQHHPQKSNEEAYLWVKAKGKIEGPLKYGSIRKLLQGTARECGIKKSVSPHKFRHGAATHCASFLTESQMNQRLGWAQGSKMSGTYVHLSGRDVDKTYKAKHGIISKEEEKKPLISTKECPICKKVNGFTNSFCIQCGSTFDIKEAMGKQLKDSFLNFVIGSFDELDRDSFEKVQEHIKKKKQEFFTEST